MYAKYLFIYFRKDNAMPPFQFPVMKILTKSNYFHCVSIRKIIRNLNKTFNRNFNFALNKNTSKWQVLSKLVYL